ncbi:phthiocerol/phthiodiolone dimycocerosyl transferase family protein [Adlercreutzia sp. ZJ141]|uniref:phthiocerol/phthiodiolone dimycocerosyl transferase family protein n=1 Tax=Adlercreutzia sp. ZJ141 TaxID=2709406 RepID=UPI0013ED415A|nr:alcohol acetyltransferase [Adlercreutzia sp. ZJ141]
MAALTWYRLDNVGKYYSAQAGSPNQAVFRLTAIMTDEVDPACLQRALDTTIALFPGFNVCLRDGAFWHYLVPASTVPRVQADDLPICHSLHVGPQSVLFRVSYHAQRFNVEVSHMISDGRGSLEFLKALISSYVAERYGVQSAPPAYHGTEETKTEDSFAVNYERHLAGATPRPRGFRLRKRKSIKHTDYLELHYSAGAVYAAAKAAKVTVTSYLIAAIICAVRTSMPTAKRNRAIRIDVPVDLRPLFESTTLRNFFGLACIAYTPGATDEPLAAVAAHVQRQLIAETQPDALKRRMMHMIRLERNPFVSFVPLPLKDVALGVAARKAALDVTCTVSSLGRMSVDPAVAPYLHGITLLSSPTNANFVLCTYDDDLSIGISSRLADDQVIRNLKSILSDEGLHGQTQDPKGR